MNQLSTLSKMRVIKRSGKYEEVSFDKILNRIRALSSSDEFSKILNIDINEFKCDQSYINSNINAIIPYDKSHSGFNLKKISFEEKNL